MTDRDRLLELIKEWHQKIPTVYLADYLLANGVFLLPEDLRGTEDFSISAFIEAMQMHKEKDRYIKTPCKVGDKVYKITRNKVKECEVVFIGVSADERCSHFNFVENYADGTFKQSYSMVFEVIGKTVFLTKVEAEAELRKRGEQNAR